MNHPVTPSPCHPFAQFDSIPRRCDNRHTQQDAKMHEPTAQALLTLYSQVAALKLLPRVGWLQRGVAGAESVADHTFGVAVLALLIGEHADGRPPNPGAASAEAAGKPQIERGKLLAIALLHDLAEALIGDLPSSARR